MNCQQTLKNIIIQDMISIFDLFSIGVGPSSSHTVGPMRAAHQFLQLLIQKNCLSRCDSIKVSVYGSLAFTGKGHATDKAILMGLMGELPESVDPSSIDSRFQRVLNDGKLLLNNQHAISFMFAKDFVFNVEDLLPYHSNGMQFTAYSGEEVLSEAIYYSIGGGFVVQDGHDLDENVIDQQKIPYPFNNAESLFALCRLHNMTIAQLIYQNEIALRDENRVRHGILQIADVMRHSIQRGCATEGVLPGGLNVNRRAPALYKQLISRKKPLSFVQTASLDWLSLYAIAVNEENAAGSRVVTAPTNGAAGVLPAVMHYYETFYNKVNEQAVIDFLLTAAAIATLYKKGASISAAEVGCQGEVGVASSMAAGALTAVLGGSLLQVECAAEIAMEHSLGLTCDPIAGLVQIPCIERNAIGANKAVNAMRLAMLESGEGNKISLDKVIDTMLRTGHDMSASYKETAQGGLAKIRVNVIEC